MAIAAALAMTAFGMSALGGASQILSGFEQRSIANENARNIENDAKWARLAGIEAAHRVRTAKYKAIGQANVAFAAGGVDPNSGSAQSTKAELATAYDLDAWKADLEGRLQERSMHQQASITRRGGAMAMRAGLFTGLSTIGVGAVQAFSDFQYGQGMGPTVLNQRS